MGNRGIGQQPFDIRLGVRRQIAERAGQRCQQRDELADEVSRWPKSLQTRE